MFEALEQFQQNISVQDAQELCYVQLQDVYDLVRTIEDEQAAQRKLRNTRRIKPFLDRIRAYTNVADILCKETELLPWIWAPVRLIIQVASESVDVLDNLLAEYGRVAEVLPKLDIADLPRHDHGFQQVLAMLYVDMLAFHQRVYCLLSNPGTLPDKIITPVLASHSNLANFRVEDYLCVYLGPLP